MMPWLRNYSIALGTLSLLAFAYTNVAAPLMQPPVVESVRLSDPQAMGTDDSLADLFPEGAWQRGSCKRLQTSDGMLLFDRWEQTADDQWKLWPITVVVGRGLSSEKEASPIVIESAEGAEIKFTESLDVMSGGAPPISRGRIIGNVRIRRLHASPNPTAGVSSAVDPSETLDIRTANVGIDNRKIWTTEAIDMRIGAAHVVGRDLTLYLAAAAGTRGANDPNSALDRMELIYLDTLTLPIEDRSGGGQPAMITVGCEGGVDYDFALDRLSLRDNVSLVYQAAGRSEDRFDCQAIELTLRDPMNSNIVRNGPFDWLLRIRAAGTPAIARLPTYGIELVAETIDFDALRGLVRASAGAGVRIQYGGVNARLAELAYQFDPAYPEAIGTLDATGSGIVEITDASLPLRRIRWQDGFKMQPQGQMTADSVTSDVGLWIDGAVSAVFADGGTFVADRIEGTLKPDTQPRPSQIIPAAARLAPIANESPKLRPDRFGAFGNVRLDTASIAAETERLTLFFVQDSTPTAGTVGESPAPPSRLRQWVSQPGANPDAAPLPLARSRPKLRGDWIAAELTLSPEGLTAQDLTVAGNVQVSHTIQAGATPLDAKLFGERLVMKEGSGDDVLQLLSGPGESARFEIGDGYFVGPQIEIRPNDNIVWINSAGEFQMPTAILPTGMAQETDDAASKGSNAGGMIADENNKPESKISWTQAPLCRWRGEMIFDGRTAVLTEGVDIVASLVQRGEPWDVHLSGDRLEVVLSQDVHVRDVQSLRQASIQQVSLMQSNERPVYAEAYRRGADGALEARHLLHSPKLALYPAGGGRLQGDGPGWYRGWMLSTETPKPGVPNAAVASTTATRAGEPKLTGIHLTYHETMQGDLAAKSLEFTRGVRVASKPIATWTESFDAAKMDIVGLSESTLDCDRLRFALDPQASASSQSTRAGMTGGAPWEMESSGGVVFRSRGENGLITGTANRAAYSSAKTLFTIQGVPNRPAVFSQTRPDGQAGPEVVVRTMTINPTTMELVHMELERLNVGVVPK